MKAGGGRVQDPGVPRGEGAAGGGEIDAILARREIVHRENIARTAALDLLQELTDDHFRRVPVYAGPGPSGACALAAARHLMNYGAEVPVYQLGPREKMGAAARGEWATLGKMGVRFQETLSPEQTRTCVQAADEAGVAVVSMPEDDTSARQAAIEGALQGLLRETGVTRVVLEYNVRFRTPRPDPAEPVFTPQTPPLTRERARVLDTVAMETYGMAGLTLMENAGWGAAREAFMMLNNPASARVVVFCGRGHNGGDGFVIARHLSWWGVAVQVFLAGDRGLLLDDPGTQLDMLEDEGLQVLEIIDEAQIDSAAQAAARATLVVDALLGTGLSGAVRPNIAALIRAINESAAHVLAVDCPSGLDCNEGLPLGACVKAQRTATFAAPKEGFGRAQGPKLAGTVKVVDISLPHGLAERVAAGQDQ